MSNRYTTKETAYAPWIPGTHGDLTLPMSKTRWKRRCQKTQPIEDLEAKLLPDGAQTDSGPSGYLTQSFEKTLIVPKEQFAIFPQELPGIRQYISLMLGITTPDEIATQPSGSCTTELRIALRLTERSANLRVLHLDAISWHILKATTPFVCLLRRAMLHLQNLKLVLKIERDTTFIQAENCRKSLESGSLYNILTSTPELVSLHIDFDVLYSDHQPARLAEIFGKQRWGSLHEVTLGQIETTQDELLAFLNRHKTTLKVILIKNMRLEYSVSWIETLRRIKTITHWDSALVCGRLFYGQQGTDEADFQYDIGMEGSQYENQCNRR
ncbi:hypothetical protein MMC18_008745 [Xylographa bjoerkii]|nr:hypothetical protein [Xylographa bjoerkii]